MLCSTQVGLLSISQKHTTARTCFSNHRRWHCSNNVADTRYYMHACHQASLTLAQLACQIMAVFSYDFPAKAGKKTK
jgi:hypothetical protein